jgi:hypothetical protein
VPEDGASCSGHVLCTYGDDWRVGCRTAASCVDRAWQIETAACPQKVPSCDDHPPISAATGELQCGKSALGLTCIYGVDVYTCTPCSGTLCEQDNTWSVATLVAGCATDAVPNLGTACATDGLYCDYNVCADDEIPPDTWAHGIGMKCDNGTWVYSTDGFACL